ncbi:MAG: Uncharacterised protein [SAR116 cluster bacterium]|nr:MAG: Uncharacterised protein [SAR116 cluster bacterium]
MVCWPVTGCIGRHIAQHAMRAAANGTAHLVQHHRVRHVTDKNLGCGQNIRFQQIDPDQLSGAAANPASVGHNLKPSARRAAKIDNGHPRTQQFIAVINLCKLQRGTGPVTLGFRLGDERVIKLARQPALRGWFTPPHLFWLARQSGIIAIAASRGSACWRPAFRFLVHSGRSLLPRHVAYDSCGARTPQRMPLRCRPSF